MSDIVVHQATVVHCEGNPFKVGRQALRFHRNGALAIQGGQILAVGEYEQVRSQLGGEAIKLVSWPGCYLFPGFIDLHVHLPQVFMLCAWGANLMEWLNKYIMPAEMEMRDPVHARRRAETLVRQLWRNGTTTALWFGPHFEEATRVGLIVAAERGFDAFMGMSLSDTLLPEPMNQPLQESYDAYVRLINEFGPRIVITDRFAVSSSPAQLEVVGRLMTEYPDQLFTTHLDEAEEELDLVEKLHHRPYWDAYGVHGLCGERSIFAHCVLTSEETAQAMGLVGSHVGVCASSNNGIGSGFAPIGKFVRHGVNFGIGSDVAAGTGFGPANEMEALSGSQMVRARYHPEDKWILTGSQMLYMATSAGAKALGLQNEIGSLRPGMRANFAIWGPGPDSIFPELATIHGDQEQELFTVLMQLNRLLHVHCTVSDGKERYQRRV